MKSYMLLFCAPFLSISRSESYSEIAREKTGAELDAQTQFSIRLYCYGTLGMTREWLMKDNITPAETVVQMMFGSMPESLRRDGRHGSFAHIEILELFGEHHAIYTSWR